MFLQIHSDVRYYFLRNCCLLLLYRQGSFYAMVHYYRRSATTCWDFPQGRIFVPKQPDQSNCLEVDCLNFYSESWFKFSFSCWMAAIVLSNFCAKVWLGGFLAPAGFPGFLGFLFFQCFLDFFQCLPFLPQPVKPLCRHPLTLQTRRKSFLLVSGASHLDLHWSTLNRPTQL